MAGGHGNGGCGEAGFTLIEALVSIALLAMLLTLLPTSLHLGRRAFEASGVVDAREQAAAWRAVLETRLSGAIDLQERNAQGGYKKVFTGASNAIEFAAEDPDGPGGGGVFRYRFGLGENGHVVFTQQRFNRIARRDGAADEPVSALPWPVAASSLRIRYLDPGRGGEPPAWKDEWTRFDAMPRLIEIDLVSPSRAWLRTPIIIEPKLR